MKQRPLSVSIISWYLIISYSLAAIVATKALLDPFTMEFIKSSLPSANLKFFLGYASSIANIVSGIGMLKGKSWARDLFAVVGLISLLVAVTTSNPLNTMGIPHQIFIVPKLILFAVFLYFLYFSKKAEAYFKKSDNAEN